MKSLERRFKSIRKRHEFWSDSTCFAEAVAGRGFTKRTIEKYHNKLVSKTEYCYDDKKDIIKHLVKLSKGAEDDTK